MGYSVQKPCKVCGKMYTPCSTCEKDNSIFHWRTVACSEKCAAIYFERVRKARMPKQETETAIKTDDDKSKIRYVDAKSNTNKEKTYQKKIDRNIKESEKIE